jgi:acetyl-CoA synthetase
MVVAASGDARFLAGGPRAMKLAEVSDFEASNRLYSKAKLWELFSSGPDSFNMTHECIDRHAGDPGRVAIRVAHADGRRETLTFAWLSRRSAQFAHWLEERGVGVGERVAFMLEPSDGFYASLFGSMRMGAIGVPLFTLFGPDGLRLRVEDCRPKILLTNPEKAPMARKVEGLEVVVIDEDFWAQLDRHPDHYQSHTSASDLAVFQYTSGTTRELPAAVKHTHGALVVLMTAALYGTGIRPGDSYFCPSSPAWGHGLWHGTLAPLALGVQTGTLAGKFNAANLVRALEEFEITNLSAAATHYRMMKLSGVAEGREYRLQKLSYTGEPIDSDTLAFIDRTFHLPACSMYGTTEIGVVLVNYPGATDYVVKPGSLGKPPPGIRLEVRAPDGTACPPGQVGELFVLRRGEWLSTKDLAKIDEDGYFYHAGRADDVIISAGWTMSAVEIEKVMLKHPAVAEVAVIGVPDDVRGQVVKAFVVAPGAGREALVEELQNFTREHLSQHEYPRLVEFVEELPKTPAGKINRKALRDQDRMERGGGSKKN